MTQEASNTLLQWMFGGLAVVGVYCVIVFPILAVFRGVSKMKAPLPNGKVDILIQQLNGESRWSGR